MKRNLPLAHARGQVAHTPALIALTVLDRRYDNESAEMDLRISRTHRDQLCGRHPALTIVDRSS